MCRDVKPGNFMFGRGRHGNDVYLIDFGLSSSYVDSHHQHIPFATNVKFRGTDKYASLNNHNRIGIPNSTFHTDMCAEPSRRDDLESLGYVLIIFLNGTLPWIDHDRNKQLSRYHSIPLPFLLTELRADYGRIKANITIEQLTENLPRVSIVPLIDIQCDSTVGVFHEYFVNIRRSEFAAKPEYDYLRKIFLNTLHTNDWLPDNIFEWTIMSNGIFPPCSSSHLCQRRPARLSSECFHRPSIQLGQIDVISNFIWPIKNINNLKLKSIVCPGLFLFWVPNLSRLHVKRCSC